MTDITAIGEALVDLIHTDHGRNGLGLFAANPGGSPANVAVAAARLGARTAFLGKVGRDNMGQLLKQTLSESGVDTSGLLTESVPTTMAVVTAAADGQPSFSFLRGADARLAPEEISEELLAHTKILHFSSASLTAGPSRSATIFAARQAHRHGVLVSFAPNYRPSLWQTPQDAEQWMTIPLPLVDIIKLSPQELRMITGTDDPEEGSRLLEHRGVLLILVTMPDRGGVFYRWHGKTGFVPGVPTHIRRTVGAGDTFTGAVLTRLCARSPHPLDGLSVQELREILSFGNHAASFVCGYPSAVCVMPTMAQLNTTESRLSQ